MKTAFEDPAAVVAGLTRNYVRFCDLLNLAEEYLRAHELAAAAALAQIAARSAFPDHIGMFGSARLESLLIDLGKQITVERSRPTESHHHGAPLKVLHVLTYARPVGGDCRFAWRWMLEDRDNIHSVVITTQQHYEGVFDIPEYLTRAAEDTGGHLKAIGASPSKPMEQARELRELCQGMDVVVLHLWPYDIVPVLALAAGCEGVKTLFVNHSDHTFWIGASVAHSIVHLRMQSPTFLKNRRGLDPSRSSILPIPLAFRPVSLTQEQAKKELGYTPQDIVLLTIASSFKFSIPGQVSFLDLVVPVIEDYPHVVLIAVGPRCEGPWHAASIQTRGRIVPLGTRWEIDALFAAADVYLDSFPFSSITSLLEAGSRGIPALGLAPACELTLLGPGAPGLESAMHLAGDTSTYRETLARLIKDAGFRRATGLRLKTQILSLHTGTTWLGAVRNLYTSVDSSNDRGCLVGIDHFDTGPLDIAIAQLYAHAYDPLHCYRLIRNYVGALGYRSRVSVTWSLHRRGFLISLLNFLPPPANGVIRAIGRSAKRLLGRFMAAWARHSA